MFTQLKNKKLFAAIFFLLISLVVIFSWFRYGFLYGGGDVGLPGYDPQRILDISKNIWWESVAPGAIVPNAFVSAPFQFAQSILQTLNFSYVVIQAIFFTVILFLMGFGMFLLGFEFFGYSKYYLAVLSGLFYMFNPYMMVSIWHRFIHNSFFLAAALPFFFIFFRSWIKSGKYSSLLFFLLANFLAVYLYGAIAFIVTVIILLLFIYIIEVLFPFKGITNLKQISIRFLMGLFFLFIANIWWVMSLINVAPAVFSSQHSVTDNLSNLISIGTQTIIPYSLMGINPFYLYSVADFSKLYDSYFFRTLPWLSLIFLVPGFVIALRNKDWALWALFLVFGLFISKGPTSPFGFPYILGFANFFPLGVLRNPFEKLGIFIPLAYAILLPLGIEWYLTKSKNVLKRPVRIFIVIILFLILGVNLWPMWLGKIFGKYDKPAFIKVPNSYQEADEYIKNQHTEGRILHFPLTHSESTTYNWEQVYKGVEPSQLFFKSLPSISRGLNLGLVDDSLTGLSYIFTLPNSEDKILSLLQSFNVKFIILHHDIDWRGGYLIDPKILEPVLDKLTFLQKKAIFGYLVIYELRDEYYKSKIELAGDISYYIPSKNNIYWPWLLAEKDSSILSPIDKFSSQSMINDGRQLAISAERTFIYNPQTVAKENLLGEMPATKILPDSTLYPLIRLKEWISTFTLSTIDLFNFKVTLAGKRLTESLLIKDKNLQRSVIPQLKEYQQILKDIMEGIEAHNIRSQQGKEISLNFIFSRHIATLELIKEKSNDSEKKIIDEVLNQLKDILKQTGTIPYNNLIGNESLPTKERLISRFNLSLKGEYELLQATAGLEHIYPGNLKNNTFQINNSLKNLSGTKFENFISYGTIELTEGVNEISYNPIPSKNLAEVSKEYKGNVKLLNDEIEIASDQHSLSQIDIILDPIRGGDDYQLTFQSWIKFGEKFRIQVIQDTDPLDPDILKETQPFYDNNFPRDVYENFWVDYLFKFYINPTTTKATVRIIVDPFNGCKFFQKPESVCLNKETRYPYERPTQVVFRNIKVVRPLKSPIFLKANLIKKSIDQNVREINFTQKTPTQYIGKLKISLPSFFIFKETLHPGWELELSKDNKKLNPKVKFLSNLYGSAWLIEEAGEYNFKLEFTPQKNVTGKITISIIGLLIILFLSIKQSIKK